MERSSHEQIEIITTENKTPLQSTDCFSSSSSRTTQVLSWLPVNRFNNMLVKSGSTSTVQYLTVKQLVWALNDCSSLSTPYHSLSPTLQFLIGNASSSSSFSCVSLYVCFFVDLFPWQIYQDPVKRKPIIIIPFKSTSRVSPQRRHAPSVSWVQDLW